MQTETTTDPAAAWEKRAEWPLTAAALLFLGAYAWPILDPDLAPRWLALCRAVTGAAWLTFVVDYVARVWLSRDRRTFVRTHLLDLAVVVLPMFRPLRLLRLLTVLRVLDRYAGSTLRGQVAVYATASIALSLLISSLAVLEAERGAEGANVETFGDALWWSFATVTTVGYGDQFPVTTGGRLIAVALMLVGIALLGVVTASVATWMLERVEEIDEESRAATTRDLRELGAQVRALRDELAELRPPGPAGDGQPVRAPRPRRDP